MWLEFSIYGVPVHENRTITVGAKYWHWVEDFHSGVGFLDFCKGHVNKLPPFHFSLFGERAIIFDNIGQKRQIPGTQMQIPKWFGRIFYKDDIQRSTNIK